MSITIDSNAPYTAELPVERLGNAVYMSAKDEVLGTLFAVIYRANPTSPKLSVLLIGAHGTSGYVNMTLDQKSKYWGACKALAPAHANSPVRRALAIAVLRTWATMDRPLRSHLLFEYGQKMRYWDEAAAGALGSKFGLLHGKYPANIGRHLLASGLISQKHVETTVVDVVYEDSDDTIDDNNQLAFLLGDQLEQLFDPLSEYSPEPTEKLYQAPSEPPVNDDPQPVHDICDELFGLVSHVHEDLAHFLQTFLVPMRIILLQGKGQISIERLNTVFAPTIDELYRVNTLLYDALQQALDFGSVEVLKACGTTIPYFYRACMRHEAAMHNFDEKLKEIESQLPLKYSSARMNSVLQNSLHLTKMRLILQRLFQSRSWPTEAKEAYDISVSTIDNFARSQPESYQRSFTPTGKLLVEITEGWPPELELGSMSRRVVTVSDAVDVLEPNDVLRALHHIVIIFTDAVVILQPCEPIPTKSSSGYHLPSVGDVLLHAMLNEVPLVSSNVPPLKVVMWAPILDVTFGSFGKRSLQVISQPEPWKCSHNSPDIFSKIYELVQPDHSASKLVELLAKAKMTTKTQPFHLFRVQEDDMTTIYSTVQELQGYREEINRTSIAIFLSTDVSPDTLDAHDLTGAVSLRCEKTGVLVNIVSRVGYSSNQRVPKENLRSHIISEVSYLITLSLSSQNRMALNAIASWNRNFASEMVKWAKLPEPKKHHRHHNAGGAATSHIGASQTSLRDVSLKNVLSKDVSSKDVSSNYSDHIAPLRLRKREDAIPSGPEHDSEKGTLDEPPAELEHRKSSLWTDSAEEDEAEQRDVDAWYHQLHQESLSSLSTDLSDPGTPAPDTIQIGGFLTQSASQLYNSCAGRAFPALSTSEDFSDTATLQSAETEAPEDFSYLAGLVDVGTDISQSPSVDSAAYPDLRESSLVRLGSFILHGDKSKAEILSHLNSQRSFKLSIPQDPNPGPSDGELVNLSDGDTDTESSEIVPFDEVDKQDADFDFFLEDLAEMQSEQNVPAQSPDIDAIDAIDAVSEHSDTDAKSLRKEQSSHSLVNEEEDAMDNWLMWDQRKSVMSLAPFMMPTSSSPDKRQSYEFPASRSEMSFRHMVMSSSLNSLQLASFMVQLEQKSHTIPSSMYKDLNAIMKFTSETFKSTKTGIVIEEIRRRQLASMTWILIGLGHPSLVKGLLDIEWIRRTRVCENFDSLETNDALTPEDLWKVQEP